MKNTDKGHAAPHYVRQVRVSEINLLGIKRDLLCNSIRLAGMSLKCGLDSSVRFTIQTIVFVLQNGLVDGKFTC